MNLRIFGDDSFITSLLDSNSLYRFAPGYSEFFLFIKSFFGLDTIENFLMSIKVTILPLTLLYTAFLFFTRFFSFRESLIGAELFISVSHIVDNFTGNSKVITGMIIAFIILYIIYSNFNKNQKYITVFPLMVILFWWHLLSYFIFLFLLSGINLIAKTEISYERIIEDNRKIKQFSEINYSIIFWILSLCLFPILYPYKTVSYLYDFLTLVEQKIFNAAVIGNLFPVEGLVIGFIVIILGIISFIYLLILKSFYSFFTSFIQPKLNKIYCVNILLSLGFGFTFYAFYTLLNLNYIFLHYGNSFQAIILFILTHIWQYLTFSFGFFLVLQPLKLRNNELPATYYLSLVVFIVFTSAGILFIIKTLVESFVSPGSLGSIEARILQIMYPVIILGFVEKTKDRVENRWFFLLILFLCLPSIMIGAQDPFIIKDNW